MHRVLVDQGSLADVMFWSTFNKVRLSPDLLRPYTGCLYGFADNQVEVRGYLELRTTFTDGEASRTKSIRYLVVNANSTYNILLGRPTLNRLNAVASTRHMKMKLPDLSGKVIVIKLDQEEARECYENSLKTKKSVFMVFERPPSVDASMTEAKPAGTTPDEVEVGSQWLLSVDGSSNQQGSGAGIVLEGPIGVLIEQALRFAFKASNNQAEHEALIAGMCTTKGRPRSHRSLTQDTLKMPRISTYADTPKEGRQMQVCALAEGDTWMTPYKRYLADGALPVEPEEGKKVKRNAARYTLVDGVLFRHGFTHPILTCVSGDECTRIMAELHEGICGSHVGVRSLASKVIRAGFF